MRGFAVAAALLLSAVLAIAARAETCPVITFHQKLLGSHTSGWENFGYSVATPKILSDFVAVGTSPSYLNDTWVYIFRRSGCRWIEEIAIKGNQTEQFGREVAFLGPTKLAVGSSEANSGYGKVYIFHRTAIGSWPLQTVITPDGGNPRGTFGTAIAGEGTTLFVGASRDYVGIEPGYSGAVYIFNLLANGSWTQLQRLKADVTSLSQYFGVSVAISNDYAIVGAEGDNPYRGGVFFYKRNSSNLWTLTWKFAPNDLSNYARLGHSVAIENDVALSGAYFDDVINFNAGSVFEFKRLGNGTWTNVSKHLPEPPAAAHYAGNFGSSVAIAGRRAIIGATNANITGMVYSYYREDNGTLIRKEILVARDAEPGDRFGEDSQVSIVAGRFAIIGARYNDDNGTNSGSAYIIELCPLEGELPFCWKPSSSISCFAGSRCYDVLPGAVAPADCVSISHVPCAERGLGVGWIVLIIVGAVALFLLFALCCCTAVALSFRSHRP